MPQNFIILLVFIVNVSTEAFYKGCDSNGEQITIRLSEKGSCIDVRSCNYLQNCTTLHGSLIVRSSVHKSTNATGVVPLFKHLREITGYLVVTFFSQDIFELLPALSVIRGKQLVQNYAFVVYFNSRMKGIRFPSLTTIYQGGVRIDRNKQLCYVDSIRWKSIVKDEDQKEKYGIVLKSNNMDCGSGCYTGQCYAAAGHSNSPNAQFCWGPGHKDDYQCQKFCNAGCGQRGCTDDDENTCCHQQCLGGCSKSNSSFHCHACNRYRIWSTGQCVPECPKNTYLVDQMFCKNECPPQQYSLKGECVQNCPAGYRVEKETCVECIEACPKVCQLKTERIDGHLYRGSLIRVPADIRDKGLIGCTEINGSLTFQIHDGTGNVEEFLKGLESITKLRGHISVKKSNLKNLNFLANLQEIDTPDDQLIHGRYAIQIYDNENLETLWTPKKKISVRSGQIFGQYNSRLCPKEFYNLQQMMAGPDGQNVTGDISEQTNGNRVPCEVERLEIQVEELNPKSESIDIFSIATGPEDLQTYLDCVDGKCIRVNWNLTKSAQSYNIIFYQLYYRKLEVNESADIDVASAITDNLQWKSADINRPVFINNMVNIKHVIPNLTPYSVYAVFLREFVSKGEERTSRIHYVNITASLPSAPLGLEASYWSSHSVQLKWRKPDAPNGKIINYNIYWHQSSYSFWKDQVSLNWCNRNIKSMDDELTDVTPKNDQTEAEEQQCGDCVCKAEKEQSMAVKADRDAHIFRTEFQERINRVVFTKPKTGQGNSNDLNDKINSLNKDAGSKKQFGKKPSKQSTYNAVKLEPNDVIDGETYYYLAEGLDYFQSYEFTVCACTEGPHGGCATPPNQDSTEQRCAVAQSRTGINRSADQLTGSVTVTNLQNKMVNLTWLPPVKPNAVILRYEVGIRYKTGNNILNDYCREGHQTYLVHNFQPGEYVARVRAVSPAGVGDWSKDVTFVIEAPEVEKDNTLVLGVSIGVAVLILVLIAFVIYYSFFRRYMEKGVPGVLYASVNPEYMNSNEVYVPDEWELNRETIELLHELGQGSFGMVYEGIAHDINGQAELRVAVKTVNENASIRERIEFLHEASIMKAFQSEHVVKLIGVVSQGQPTFVVMELMARGDLKTFLRSRRPEEKNSTLLPPMRAEMLQMAAEIADGMAYLAARKYIHRDLAARNCMVAIDFTVKIGDFGMARDIYETDYYRKGGKGLLPIRWMAPESLRDGIFTTSSDVWSFGVVLWEIATLAAQPYQGKTNEEVLKHVISGNQLEYPSDCDKQMQNFMELCWARDPKLRPSFLEIIRLLEDDVSDDFVACSFYHEMKKKALEDTLCQEGNLYELLSRPNSTPRPNIDAIDTKRRGSTVSDDSGACVEGCKPELEPSSFDSQKGFPIPDERTRLTVDCSPVSNRSNKQQNYKSSMYDNLDDTMTYGASPVAPTNSDRNDPNDDLDLKKIFYGKAVKV